VHVGEFTVPTAPHRAPSIEATKEATRGVVRRQAVSRRTTFDETGASWIRLESWNAVRDVIAAHD